jgi:hypothetical protein
MLENYVHRPCPKVVPLALNNLVAKEMIAVKVGPDLRMAVVGSPCYFANRKKARAAQELAQWLVSASR